jgi:hypothetical protein
MELSPLDESFGHQLVAPRTVVQHPSPDWAERCFHLLHAEDGTLVCLGRQLYPVAGRRFAFAAVSRDGKQHVRRVATPFTPGDDPDATSVGPVHVGAKVPLREVSLRYTEPDAPFEVDLAYSGRWLPRVTDPLQIVQDDRVVTHYQNFFQSGWYDGQVRVGGATVAVERRAGFRDRGWGLRKHEGSPRRGLVLNCACEGEDLALYGLMFETASGRRVLTSAWILGGPDPDETVAGVEHDLRFSPTHLLEGGVFRFHTSRGRAVTVECEIVNRLFYSEIGYTVDDARRGDGSGSFDLADPDTLAQLYGQMANAAVFMIDGRPAHGYVETGLGTHARYRPE